MGILSSFLGGFGDWVAPVVGIIKDGLTPDRQATEAAQSKGLMAPPSPPNTKSRADIYDVQKFSPKLGYDRSAAGGTAPNAVAAIQSADPVSREVQFWTQVMAKSKAQAKIQ